MELMDKVDPRGDPQDWIDFTLYESVNYNRGDRTLQCEDCECYRDVSPDTSEESITRDLEVNPCYYEENYEPHSGSEEESGVSDEDVPDDHRSPADGRHRVYADEPPPELRRSARSARSEL